MFSGKDTNGGGSGGGAAKNRDLAHFRDVVKYLDLPVRIESRREVSLVFAIPVRGQKQQESDGTNKHRDSFYSPWSMLQPILGANICRPYSSGVFWCSTVSRLD